MKKLLIVLAIPLVLAACKDQEEIRKEKTYIDSQLPDGCKLVDLGEYSDIDRVVAVVCEGRDTTSLSTYEVDGSGKTRTEKRYSMITIH